MGKTTIERGVSIEDLRQRFDADFDMGLLIWRERPADTQGSRAFNTKYAGKVAGGPDKRGYTQVSIGGRLFFAHRLLWAMLHGAWPEGDIDHINGASGDNRAANLRCVPHAENQRNLKRAKNNTTGVAGVTVHTQTGKYVAKIKKQGKSINLGSYSTLGEASAARRAAQRSLGFHENHGRAV